MFERFSNEPLMFLKLININSMKKSACCSGSLQLILILLKHVQDSVNLSRSVGENLVQSDALQINVILKETVTDGNGVKQLWNNL